MNDVNLYPVKNSVYLKKISSKLEISKEDDCEGYLVETNEKEARRIIDSLKGKKKIIAIRGSDDAFNRRVIETMNIDYLVSPEIGNKRDTLRQVDSGINHVVAKEAKKKDIKILIDLKKFRDLEKKERSKILARMMQNVEISRKAGCEMKIASFAQEEKEIIDEKGRQSFGTTLGMSSQQVRDCTRF